VGGGGCFHGGVSCGGCDSVTIFESGSAFFFGDQWRHFGW